MAKYPPKRPNSQSNWRTSIHHHVKLKIPKKLQQQPSWKTESIKINAIMEQLDELDGKGHCKENNTNHLAQLYESEDGS